MENPAEVIMSPRKIKDYLLILIKGAGMGAADVVPGVSGGTIAFITGIYEELIFSIRNFPKALPILFTKGPVPFWKYANATFLLTLMLGILFSVVSLARVITYLLNTYPVIIWSFFFGLILASTVFVIKKIRINIPTALFFLSGASLAYYITIAAPVQTPESMGFVFLSGFIAICAMILPGISGSFILLLLGKYDFILHAVKNFDIKTILIFMVGCLVGVFSFAQVISWLFKRFYAASMALLAGFMVGSLNKVWPWKIVTQYRLNSKNEMVPFLDKSVTFGEYEAITGQNGYVLYAAVFMLVGFISIFLIEKLSVKKKILD